MKLLLLAVFAFIATTRQACNKQKTDENTCFKGRLEIKAMCMNYTIKVLEGPIDTNRIAAQWTDEHTGKSYTNVFALGSPCNFPSTINEGDEFYFKIDTTTTQNCAVCMAYYPKPAKHLQIKVLPAACN